MESLYGFKICSDRITFKYPFLKVSKVMYDIIITFLRGPTYCGHLYHEYKYLLIVKTCTEGREIMIPIVTVFGYNFKTLNFSSVLFFLENEGNIILKWVVFNSI